MAKKVSGLPDALAPTTSGMRTLKAALNEASMEREAVLGLRFQKGQEVIDLVTGKRGTVEGGTRKAVTVQHAGT